ncbi:hypothetical protein J6590_069862 [Homalodisca vitripennis]|nr:hypothetical protein J6590_069862 [Homalodisca vitripennis]
MDVERNRGGRAVIGGRRRVCQSYRWMCAAPALPPGAVRRGGAARSSVARRLSLGTRHINASH